MHVTPLRGGPLPADQLPGLPAPLALRAASPSSLSLYLYRHPYKQAATLFDTTPNAAQAQRTLAARHAEPTTTNRAQTESEETHREHAYTYN